MEGSDTERFANCCEGMGSIKVLVARLQRSQVRHLPCETGGGGGTFGGSAGLSPQASALLSFPLFVVEPVACLLRNGFVVSVFGLRASWEPFCESEGGPTLKDSGSGLGAEC